MPSPLPLLLVAGVAAWALTRSSGSAPAPETPETPETPEQKAARQAAEAKAAKEKAEADAKAAADEERRAAEEEAARKKAEDERLGSSLGRSLYGSSETGDPDTLDLAAELGGKGKPWTPAPIPAPASSAEAKSREDSIRSIFKESKDTGKQLLAAFPIRRGRYPETPAIKGGKEALAYGIVQTVADEAGGRAYYVKTTSYAQMGPGWTVSPLARTPLDLPPVGTDYRITGANLAFLQTYGPGRFVPEGGTTGKPLDGSSGSSGSSSSVTLPASCLALLDAVAGQTFRFVPILLGKRIDAYVRAYLSTPSQWPTVAVNLAAEYGGRAAAGSVGSASKAIGDLADCLRAAKP